MTNSADPGWLRLLPIPLRNKLEGQTSVHTLIHNSGWLFVDKIVRMALGLLVGVWMARYLGPAQYGELSYVLTYIAFFQVVASLGMDGIVVREISHNCEQAGQILGSAFVLRILAGSLCWLLAVGWMAGVNGFQDRSVWLTALAGLTLVFQAVDTIDLWFQSQSQNRYTVLAKLIAYLLSTSIKVMLILNHANLFAFTAVISFDALVAATGLAIAYRRSPTSHRWKQTSHIGKQLLMESWPFIISGISIVIYMRIDQIMIKKTLGDNALGVYTAVLTIAQAPNFVPIILSTALMPLISRLFQNDKEKYKTALIKIFRVFFFSALLMSVAVGATSQNIINTLYGKDFYQAGSILKIYIFSSCFTWIGVAHSLWLINERKSKVRLFGTLISATTCALLNIFLLPIFGITAAAWIAITTQSISAFFINALIAKESFTLQTQAIFYRRKNK